MPVETAPSAHCNGSQWTQYSSHVVGGRTSFHYQIRAGEATLRYDMKSSTQFKAKQSSARKRKWRVPIDDIVSDSDVEDKHKKKCKPKGKQWLREGLVHSSVWFNRSIANDLWMPTKVDKISWAEFDRTYRPIANLRHIPKYFRNKKVPHRHKAVNDEVEDSAFRDFIKATKASIAGCFAAKSRNEKTTFPEMRFKSIFAPSSTIEIAKRSINRVLRDGNECVRFHPKFFGFNNIDGIFYLRGSTRSNHVDAFNVSKGTYFLIVPRLRQFAKPSNEHVCAIDPGVRNFSTVYNLDDRALSATDI